MALFDDLNIDVFLKPNATDGPGYNRVTSNADFSLVGTVDGYAVVEDGLEVVQLSAGDRLEANSGFGAGTYYKEIDENTQFWVLIYWNPRGDTTPWQVGWQTANGANPGLRIRIDGPGAIGNSIQIRDSSGSVTVPIPSAVLPSGDWDNTIGNTLLVQVDVPNEFIEVWQNNRSQRNASFNRRSLSALSWGATPTANAIDAQIDLNGDVMFMSGTGILTEEQIERLMRYGKCLSWDDLTNDDAAPRFQNSWRADPDSTSVKVVGNFDSDPNLRIYTEINRTTRGSLVASSGTLTRDAQGWCNYTFTGLDPDTRYQVFAEYSTGEQDARRMQLKTLPASRNLTIVAAGCYELDPDIAIGASLSVDSIEKSVFQGVYNADADLFVSTGDDGYYDNIWTANLAQAGLPTTVADFQLCHAEVFHEMKANQFFERINAVAGAFSDHDAYGNDLWGDEVTNAAGAKAHLEQRYGRTYPLAGSLYYSWNVGSGITFIALDTRTESDEGVQLTSTAQRTQFSSDLQAAVARRDLIVLFSEFAWDSGETPAPGHSWENYPAERTDIFNRIVAADANERILCLFGDHHATGVDIDGVDQGGFDSGGICRPPGILASRMNHTAAGSAAAANVFPDYYDNGAGHHTRIVITTRGSGEIDLAVTPWEGSTEKSTFTRSLAGYQGSAPFYIAVGRRTLNAPPRKRTMQKSKGGFRGHFE